MKTYARCHASGVVWAVMFGLIAGMTARAVEKQPSDQGTIEVDKTQFSKQGGEAWNSRGRIVGVASDAPVFTVAILTLAGQPVTMAAAGEAKGGRRPYGMWLDPGTYRMVVSAAGYLTLELKAVEVQRGGDLRIDIKFSKVRAERAAAGSEFSPSP